MTCLASPPPTSPARPTAGPPLARLSGDALLRRVAAGDGEAFAEFYRRHLPFVRGVLAASSRPPGWSLEDLVQDVFLDVWRSAGRYDPRVAPVLTWLRTIVVRRRIDRARKAAITAQATALEPPEQAAPETLAWDERLALVDEFRRLPDVNREALALVYWGGLTFPEVARVTGAPLGTAKSRAILGLRRLARTV